MEYSLLVKGIQPGFGEGLLVKNVLQFLRDRDLGLVDLLLSVADVRLPEKLQPHEAQHPGKDLPGFYLYHV